MSPLADLDLTLHLSGREEGARREKDPLKSWKLTDDDWRNGKRRRAYLRAVEDMLDRTDHDVAPWHLVEAEDKRYARVRVVETVCREIERGMAERGFTVPEQPKSKRSHRY